VINQEQYFQKIIIPLEREREREREREFDEQFPQRKLLTECINVGSVVSSNLIAVSFS
jgi:hypothetical protein